VGPVGPGEAAIHWLSPADQVRSSLRVESKYVSPSIGVLGGDASDTTPIGT
jgi:hypothetical protein